MKARYMLGRLNALADLLSRKRAIVPNEWSPNQEGGHHDVKF